MRPILIIIILSLATIYSCDPVYFAEIKNNSSEQVKIQIGFDREYLEETWQGNKSYIEFLKSYPNWTNIPPAINFDTINLVKTYKIDEGESFPLSSGIGGYPDLGLIRYLLILDTDSTLIENKEQLENAFKIKDGRHWIMEIE